MDSDINRQCLEILDLVRRIKRETQCAPFIPLPPTTYKMTSSLCTTNLMAQREGENVQPNTILANETTVIIDAEGDSRQM